MGRSSKDLEAPAHPVTRPGLLIFPNKACGMLIYVAALAFTGFSSRVEGGKPGSASVSAREDPGFSFSRCGCQLKSLWRLRHNTDILPPCRTMGLEGRTYRGLPLGRA